MRLALRWLLATLCLAPLALHAAPRELKVFRTAMRSEVNASSWHLLKQAFRQASESQSELIILSINTYGGALDMADSMRTLILNSPIPVWAFIDNQAASAGALIALACDSIYMRRGASIGAATVVGSDGQPMPDKYQSFMRSMMRSTAQAKGYYWPAKDVGEYRRRPELAEAMVDPSVAIPGVVDSLHVLTLTTEEAIQLHLCEGSFESVEAILEHYNMTASPVEIYEASPLDRVKGLLLSPVVSGLLIMLIVGGIYFELQTPGVGLPLAVAVLAAIAYFAPLYIDGLVQHIDLILFLAGLVLLLVEIFAIPGFGITGISGIACIVLGLALALVDNETVFRGDGDGGLALLRAVAIVIVSLTLGLIGSIVLGGMLIKSPRLSLLSLRKSLDAEDGYVGVAQIDPSLVGATGVASTVLRPSGKVQIDGHTYDAIAEGGMIDRGATVRVVRIETNQVYVECA